MICDRVQAELSDTLDEGGALSSRAARHLSGCPDCEAFRAESLGLAERYAKEVRAGIERLRGAEPEAAPRRRPALWSAALAAACVLCWWGRVPTPPAAPVVPAPAAAATPASRTRLFESPELVDRAEVSFLFEREVLPVRLNQDLLPARSDLSEIRLPPSLRF
jgi:hypothetical protein